jgi:hypothetical protein
LLASKLSSKGRFSIAVASANVCYFFKLNFSKEQKTVLASSQVKIEESEKFFDVRITSNTTLSVVYGSVFNMTKKSIELTEGLYDLTKKTVNQSEQKLEVGEVQIQDAVMTEHTLRLLPSDLVENLESAVTSVSRK